MSFLKVFWYDSTSAMNPRSTDCKADALTTMPSSQCKSRIAERLKFKGEIWPFHHSGYTSYSYILLLVLAHLVNRNIKKRRCFSQGFRQDFFTLLEKSLDP